MKQSTLMVLSLTGYLMMVAGLLLLLLNNGLLSTSFFVILPQLFALVLMIWARITFGRRSFHAGAAPTEGGLVTTGPYRFVRHPIYASVLLFLSAGIVGNLNMTNIGLGLVTVLGTVVRISCEESLVRRRYPEYDEYSRKTKRLIPHVV